MFFLLAASLLYSCAEETPPTSTRTSTTPAPADTGPQSEDTDPATHDTGAPPELEIYSYALGCYSVRGDDGWLAATEDGGGFTLSADSEQAARVFMKPSDLGTYLLYDRDGGYLVDEDGSLLRQTRLTSDVELVDDSYISGAEWHLQTSTADPSRYQLESRRTGQILGALTLEEADGCLEHPELSLHASGTPAPQTFEDGSLFGIVDTHSHILSNWGFGGGGIYHGAPFHRLGVEHALGDCAVGHGEQGRKDLFGYAYDTQGAGGTSLDVLLPAILLGELEVDNHATAGYPDFTEWPDARKRSTHQTQYYRWLERAWLSGLRLVVQHATSNSAICHLSAGQGIQPTRYSCEDMDAVDRIIEETHAMERYIDAQSGGPGQGWFRVVFSPEQAREVIGAGKLAVILGIETSDVFQCRLTPRSDSPVCDEAYVSEQLDAFYEQGVRAVFPVHKFDNAFSSSDGSRDFMELGNFFNSGHWLNYVEDCPADIPTVFDKGGVTFAGLNQPREDYLSEAPNDMSGFPDDPLLTVIPFYDLLSEGSLEGDYCQKTGFTELGEYLVEEMMARGMILEVDHLPRRSYQRAFEILEANDYPAVGSHGNNFYGRIYELGGVSKTSLGTCRDPDREGATLETLTSRIDQITAAGGYPAEGFGFDLNGFAGARGPRFGDEGCSTPQEDPVEYPFTSYAGDATFTEPSVGNRPIDFNTEGFVHIGLLPEMLEDARGDAESDADLEPLFRSAEGYIRMWEKAEQRSAELGGR